MRVCVAKFAASPVLLTHSVHQTADRPVPLRSGVEWTGVCCESGRDMSDATWLIPIGSVGDGEHPFAHLGRTAKAVGHAFLGFKMARVRHPGKFELLR